MTTTTFEGSGAHYSARLLLVSPSECDWDFGWDDWLGFMGIGVLHCGPLRLTVTWPPEDSWADAFSMPLRIAGTAAVGVAVVAIGLLADVALRLRGF